MKFRYHAEKSRMLMTTMVLVSVYLAMREMFIKVPPPFIEFVSAVMLLPSVLYLLVGAMGRHGRYVLYSTGRILGFRCFRVFQVDGRVPRHYIWQKHGKSLQCLKQTYGAVVKSSSSRVASGNRHAFHAGP